MKIRNFTAINETLQNSVNKVVKNLAKDYIKNCKKQLIKQHAYYNITGKNNPILDEMVRLIIKKR